jgi:hypothetical protein
MLLSSDWYDEWKEEDFEDFEPVSSGGEPGIGGLDPTSSLKVIASLKDGVGEVMALRRVAILAVWKVDVEIDVFQLEASCALPLIAYYGMDRRSQEARDKYKRQWNVGKEWKKREFNNLTRVLMGVWI